jgi:hypothetical protein
MLENDEWKHDKIPEIFDGKNVYDFIDKDIEAKLAALEEEEEKLEAEGYYDSDEDLEDAEDAEIRMKADMIREKRILIRNEAKMKKSLKNRAIIPRTATRKKLTDMEDHLDSLGLDTTAIGARARSQSRGRSQLRSRTGTEDVMDIDSPDYEAKMRAKMRAKSRARSQSNRRDDGVTNEVARTKAERAQKLSQRKMNRMARQGEADRHVAAAMPKHLVCPLSAFIFHLRMSLTNYSSPVKEVWARPIVVKCLLLVKMTFFPCPGVWELEVNSIRDVKTFILEHLWSSSLLSKNLEGLHYVALCFRYLEVKKHETLSNPIFFAPCIGRIKQIDHIPSSIFSSEVSISDEIDHY